MDQVILPAMQIPSFRVKKAFDDNVQDNFLINTWGGLGDQICAEPAIRYAVENFLDKKISLSSECPELFSHLRFHNVFDTRKVKPELEKYAVFQTITPHTHLNWEFYSHMLTHCVDYVSLCMWRRQLPIAYREIVLPDFKVTESIEEPIRERENTVVLHAGKHWQSKTFPKAWWDEVIKEFIVYGWHVTLIGKEVDDNVGYVNVNGAQCFDTRDKLSIPEWVSLLKNCKYLLSNDSSPIHAAAAGDAFIGFIASCKHPDFIMHWRNGIFGYNMHNFGLDGAWNHMDENPCQKEKVEIETLPTGLMEKLLPNPKEIVWEYNRRRAGH